MSNSSLVGERPIAARMQVLVGAVLVQLILGTVYGYSVFWQPLERELWPVATVENPTGHGEIGIASSVSGAASDFAGAVSVQEKETRIGYLKYSFAICLLSFAGAMLFAGRLQDIKGPRFTALVGGVILSTGFLAAGQMSHPATVYICQTLLIGAVIVLALIAYRALCGETRTDRHRLLRYVPYGIVTVVIVAGVVLSALYITSDVRGRLLVLWGTIGVLAGVGIGFAYVCPIAALVKWFPRQKGLMAGIAVAGFGFGAYLFSRNSAVGAVGFIESHGIRNFFVIHGLVCLIVVGVGALLLSNPPAPTAASATDPSSVPDSNATWQQLVRTGRFYIVWLMFFSGAMAGLMVIGILKPFAGAQLVKAASVGSGPLSDALRSDLLLKGATAVGVLALFNAAGRIIWGLVSDRIGRVTAMMLMFVFQGVTMLVLNTLDTEWLLAVGAACVGFNFGGNFALFPSLTADLFGARNFGANYAWVFTSYGVAGVIGVWVGNLAQRTTGTYFAAFAVAAVLCFLSAGLALLLGRSRRVPA